MDLSGPAAPGRREPLVASIRERCARGRVPEREIACVMAASTRAELIECTTGRPAIATAEAPPPPQPKGTNAVTLVAMRNAGDFKPLDFAAHEDQRIWLEELKKEIAGCATEEVYDPPRQYVVIATFSPEATAISLGGIPAPLAYCVRGVLSRKQPSSVGNGPSEVVIDVGR